MQRFYLIMPIQLGWNFRKGQGKKISANPADDLQVLGSVSLRGTAMFGVGFSLYSLYHPLGGDLGAIPHLDIDDCNVIGERLGRASWAVHKSDCRD